MNKSDSVEVLGDGWKDEDTEFCPNHDHHSLDDRNHVVWQLQRKIVEEWQIDIERDVEGIDGCSVNKENGTK